MRTTSLIATLSAVMGMLMLASCASTPPVLTPPKGTPVKVSLCKVLADPAAYNHKLIEVTGDVSRGFEDFTLTDTSCKKLRTFIWLETGGRVGSQVVYCCGVSDKRSRKHPLTVQGFETTILQDKTFRTFQSTTRNLHAFHTVKVRLIGRYFADERYGHMGMYSLLVIEQVTDVYKHP